MGLNNSDASFGRIPFGLKGEGKDKGALQLNRAKANIAVDEPVIEPVSGLAETFSGLLKMSENCHQDPSSCR